MQPRQYPAGSDPALDLPSLRTDPPLNAETPFADTAAAFSALPEAVQEALRRLLVRRRKYPAAGDDG